MTFLRAHWLKLLVLGMVAGAFWTGRATAPRPKVELHQELDRAASASGTTDTHLQTGPIDATITVGPPCASAAGTGQQPDQVRPARQRSPATIAEAIADLPPGSTVTLHQGPSTEDTHATTQSVTTERQRTDLTISPAELPRFAFAGGFEDLFGAQSPRFEVGARVLTLPLVEKPLWLRVGNTPARGLLKGTSVMLELQW